MPASTYRVSINLALRKFFCKNPKCLRKIFSEQPGSEISAYSRMTNRTRQKLQNILIEVSARKGSYIAGQINLPISSSIALRLVNRMPIPSFYQVKVLGMDDWANRKGLTYWTILVDDEKRRVFDILPGRDVASLKEWLKGHPEVKEVTRDRASSFSKAVAEILPDTIQIADRFHLLKNLSDCVYDVLRLEYRSLDIAKSFRISRNTVRCYSKMDTYISKITPVKNNCIQYQHYIESELANGKTIKALFDIVNNSGYIGLLTCFYEFFRNYSTIRVTKGETLSVIKYRMISPRKISDI